MADNPQKPMKTKESDSAREAGAERTQVRPEVAKSAQVDARGMQEVENTRTNKHSGSASELEWNKGNRGNGDRASAGDGNGGADGKAGKTSKEGKDGESGKSGGDGDSITIEAVDETGKKFTVASRVSGGTERDFLAKGEKGEGARGAPVERGQKEGEAKELVREDLTASARELGEKPQERFQTRELKAIQADKSLPAEKRVLAEQLQQMRSMAKEANQPTDEIDRFATEAFKDDIRKMRGSDADEAGTFQAISDMNRGKGSELTESAVPSEAASPQVQSQSQARHLDEDGRPIVDHQAEQLDKKTFSLGLTYEEGTPPPAESPGDKGTDKVTEVANRPAASADAPHNKGIGEVMSELGSLPLDKQIQIVGMGIQVFQESLHKQQVDIAKGVGEGVKEGFEAIYDDAANLVKGVGQAWQFGEDVMTNNPRALETSAKAGEAIGKTLVGGVRLFQMSHDYLYDIGYTGDYSKPFKDISNLAQELDRRWNEMTPAEQARMTAKFSTQFLGEMAIPMGASKIAKSEKITTALEEIALKAKAMGGKATGKVAEGIADVVDGLTDMVTPTEELATAGGPPLGRRKLSDIVEDRRKLGDEDFFKRPTTPEVAEVASESPSRRILHQPIDGISPEDYIEKMSPKEKLLDMLDDVGFGNKRRLNDWRRMEVQRLAELPNPLDPKFNLQEKAKIALERMVKPWGIENPKILEHYERCKSALKSLPPEDIMSLYGKGGDDAYRIHFPNKTSDVEFHYSKHKAHNRGSDRVHHLGGVTNAEEKFTSVPRLRRDSDVKGWVKQETVTGLPNGLEFHPEGVVRHEMGMCLMEVNNWKTPKVKTLYASCFADSIAERNTLMARLKDTSLSAAERASISDTLECYVLVQDHYRASGIGIDQVLADLYAIKYGGSCRGTKIDNFLKSQFGKISDFLDSKEVNWYRKTGKKIDT